MWWAWIIHSRRWSSRAIRLLIPQVELTPKAFANWSPGLELVTTLGLANKGFIKPCKGLAVGEPLQGSKLLVGLTQGSRCTRTLGSN
jgi:hypothetical protein